MADKHTENDDSYAVSRVPSAVQIGGESSPLLVQHLTRLIAGAMGHAKVLQVGGAGHMLPVTHPAAAAKLLNAHVFAAEAHASRPKPRAA